MVVPRILDKRTLGIVPWVSKSISLVTFSEGSLQTYRRKLIFGELVRGVSPSVPANFYALSIKNKEMTTILSRRLFFQKLT